MGKSVVFWDALLYGLIGLAISIGVIIVGPMLTFAFLIIPPLAVRRYCRRMSTFFAASAGVGGLSGLAGFYLSYHLDWPLGPADIAMTGLALLAAFAIKKTSDVFSARRAQLR
jgi:manganese/zinc/iron transport system permease protein